MGATSSKPLSVTSRNSRPSDFPSIAPSSMLSPTSQPRLSPIRSIPCRQSLSVLLSREKLITRVGVEQRAGGEEIGGVGLRGSNLQCWPAYDTSVVPELNARDNSGQRHQLSPIHDRRGSCESQCRTKA